MDTKPAGNVLDEFVRMSANHILLISCPDAKGLVHKITGVVFRHDLNIVSNGEFVDPQLRQFFMRTEIAGDIDAAKILAELRAVLPANAQAQLTPQRAKKIVLLATREPHCLGDLLLRHAYGELNAEILAVISNHSALARLVGKFELDPSAVGKIPFHEVPHDGKTREQHEAEVLSIINRYDPEFVVLAKYMRVLTAGFTRQFPQRIINIHHSFLPAFVGAQPYKQAYDRGVKIIGATAHFVTDQLDEGPILAQSVIPVDHTHGISELTQAGREIEKLVLAKALRLVFEERVFVAGNKTIIFE